MPDDAPTMNKTINRTAVNADICSILRQAFSDRDSWERTAKEYAMNATYWQEKAEKAERQIALEEIAPKTRVVSILERNCQTAEAKLVGMTTTMQHWRGLAGQLSEQLDILRNEDVSKGD